MRIYLLLTFAFLSIYTYGQQQHRLQGFIINEKQQPVPGATVTIYSQEGALLEFATANAEGQFTIPLRRNDYKVIVRSLGYNAHELLIDDKWFSNEELRREIKMVTSPLELEEVTITHHERELDSVAINIDSLGLSETSNLKEILSKLPEFKLDNDGTIIYRGRNIDKINVNGRQVFVNQNKTALQAIEKRMIDHLDIIKNYQDNFTLTFEDTEETILNLKGKDDFKNLLAGDVTGGLGFRNKYNVDGKAFYFSERLNAFLIHDINNIGALNLESKEINSLFSDQQTFSELEGELINNLFSKNLARAKDFRSTTSLTLRKEMPKFRIQTVAYYLSNEQETSSSTSNIAETGAPILSTNGIHRNSYDALFHKTSIDYRLTNNSMLNYRTITNFVHGNGYSGQQTDIYSNGSLNTTTNLASRAKLQSTQILNDVGYSQKFSNKWISTLGLSHYLSYYDYLTSITEPTPEALDILFSPSFRTDAWSAKASVKYRLSRLFIPSITYSNKKIKETINTDQIETLKRDQSQRQFQIEMAGDGLLRYIKYRIHWAPLKFNTTADDKIYHPYRYDISIDKKLTSIYIRGNRTFFLNDISSGVNLLRNFTDIHYGNYDLSYRANRTDNHTVGYAYTNLFKGIAYSSSLTYQSKYNLLRPSFNNANELGLLTYDLRSIPRSTDLKFNINASKNILSRIYPLKLDMGIRYNYGNSPTYYGDILKDVVHKGPSLSFGLISLNSSWFNFDMTSQANLYQIVIDVNSFDNQSITNQFTLKARTKSLETRLDFVYQEDLLYGNRFNRKNINISVEKRSEKIAYGFKSLNIDDFFNLFNNAAYGNYVVYDQGINTVVSNDNAIRYAIFYIKYIFK